jgi:ABC-type multidrug transport system fused ATPase/permease subunit
MTFKQISARYIEPAAQWIMIVGIICLMQPWNLFLHRYGVTIILVGLVGFIVFSHIKPSRGRREAEACLAERPPMAQIVLRDIEKYFGDNYVIRKLNLTIEDKEFVVLLGPSGCGKTTTLRAIAGLEEIDSGDILIDGKPVQTCGPERDIAFVFQLFALYPHLTVYENIAFPLKATRRARRRSTATCARSPAR